MKHEYNIYKAPEYMDEFYGDIWRGSFSGYMYEEGETSRVILKSKHGYTPTGCARDMGDYLIIARYSRYDKLVKATGELIKDVNDC